VPAGGGEPEVLTKPDRAHGELAHVFPSVLPGGRAVLFTITASDLQIENEQVAVLDLKTGQRKTLIRGGSQAEYVEPGYLVYGVAGTLRAVRFDLKTLEVRGDAVPVVEQVVMLANGAAEYGVSRTGALVYVPGGFSTHGTIRSLVWIDRKGHEEPIKAPPRAYYSLRPLRPTAADCSSRS
jgi:serine/threonine-protein kinase